VFWSSDKSVDLEVCFVKLDPWSVIASSRSVSDGSFKLFDLSSRSCDRTGRSGFNNPVDRIEGDAFRSCIHNLRLSCNCDPILYRHHKVIE
jgi:hypothetical protein